MSLQILSLRLDGITAGDYLTWCRDPDPPGVQIHPWPASDAIVSLRGSFSAGCWDGVV